MLADGARCMDRIGATKRIREELDNGQDASKANRAGCDNHRAAIADIGLQEACDQRRETGRQNDEHKEVV